MEQTWNSAPTIGRPKLAASLGGEPPRGKGQVNYKPVRETIEMHGDLLTSKETCIAHCISADRALSQGIARDLVYKFGPRLRRGTAPVGRAELIDCGRVTVCNLVTKELKNNKPTYTTLRDTLHHLKWLLHRRGTRRVAFPKIGCGLDHLDWEIVSQMIAEIFGTSKIQAVVYLNDRPASGNAKVQRSQHPLLLKHRWSKEDLERAPREILMQRLVHLESTVNELRKIRNSTSSVKCVDATSTTRKVKRGGMGGASASLPCLAPSFPPSIRKTVSSPCGMNAAPAPRVIRRPSVKRLSSEPHLADTAIAATTSTAISAKPLVTATPRSTKPAKKLVPILESAGDEGENLGPKPDTDDSKHVRLSAPYKGASYAATLKAGKTKLSDNPIFTPALAQQCVQRPPQAELVRVRRANNVVTDEELSQMLQWKFMNMERDVKTPLKMKKAVENYLHNFDMSQVSFRELREMTGRAIMVAMVPDPTSVEIRNFFKNGARIHEMEKQNAFVNKGDVGKSGFFSRNKSLPSTS
nr:hypothetical protein 1 [signal crayfish associated tombus-like virus 1]